MRAAWTFVVWGALHGGYLLRQSCVEQQWPRGRAALRARGECHSLRADLVSVVVAWVFFRADSISSCDLRAVADG